jgi:hypothetical protein
MIVWICYKFSSTSPLESSVRRRWEAKRDLKRKWEKEEGL